MPSNTPGSRPIGPLAEETPGHCTKFETWIMNDVDIPDIALTENTSQRLPYSGSMAGAPVDAFNTALRLFEQDLRIDDVASQRVQLSIIRFGDNNEVTMLSDSKDAMDFQAPQIDANGATPLGAAVVAALNKIEEQKARSQSISGGRGIFPRCWRSDR
jgi:hypothetical protein